MKKKIALNLWFFLALIFGHQLLAQYDDIYYNPNTDDDDYWNSEQKKFEEDDYTYYDPVEGENYNDGYSSTYEYEDDYDYYYTSRIRRFHRPMTTIGFYDPFYMDVLMYDPFWNMGYYAGSSIYISFGSRYSWNRWNRWNYSPYGYNSYRYNRWGNPYGWGNYYGWNDPYGWNNYYGCPTSYSHRPSYWYNEDRYQKQHWGSRQVGSGKTSPSGKIRKSPRLEKDYGAPRSSAPNSTRSTSPRVIHNDRNDERPSRSQSSPAVEQPRETYRQGTTTEPETSTPRRQKRVIKREDTRVRNHRERTPASPSYEPTTRQRGDQRSTRSSQSSGNGSFHSSPRSSSPGSTTTRSSSPSRSSMKSSSSKSRRSGRR